jgi:N utilization substance protein A
MSEIEKAIRQICEEKNIPYELVIGTIEAALAAAYRKDFGEKDQNVKVEFIPETGGSRVYDEKTVVADELYDDAVKILEEKEALRVEGKLEKKELTEEERAREKELALYPKMHIPFTEAKKIKKDVQMGEVLRRELEVPSEYGRMAAQTAKQVIIQKLRETERDMVFSAFKEQEGNIVIATVQRREGTIVILDIGRATAIMLADDQIRNEFYRPGERLKVYVKSVEKGTRGPEILVSRTHQNIVKQLFESEIPEVASGVVEIKGIAREAGSRTKIAVYTADKNIDPIGSCIGQRGSRIQTIIGELGGEKIDVVLFDEDPVKFISNSLSPAKVISLETNQSDKTAVAKVLPDQFSLAIGKSGQNVRLAAKLTGWKINVREERADDVKPAEITVTPEEGAPAEAIAREPAPAEESAPVAEEKPKRGRKKKTEAVE